MINYTQEQLNSLISELFKGFLYHGLMFNPDPEYPLDFPYDKIIREKLGVSICFDTKVIDDNWSNFKKKISYSTPRGKRQMIRRMGNTLFKVPFYKLPLHINDPVTGPIVAWRLRNII